MSLTSFRKAVRNWALPLTATLGFLAATAAIPTVYDQYDESDVPTMYAANDTTYEDGTFVILKTASCVSSICFVEPPYPEQFTVRWKQDVSQLLLLTYETGFGDALDSAAVDSIWEAWGMYSPYAYAVDVPGTPPPIGCDTCTIGDTSNAITYWFADWFADSAAFVNDYPDGQSYSTAGDAQPWKATVTDTTAYGTLEKSVQMNYIYDTYLCNEDVGSGCKAITNAITLHNDIHNKGTTDSLYRTLWWEFSFRMSAKAFSCSYNEDWGDDNLPHLVPTDTFSLVGYINYEGPCAWKFQEFNNTAGDDWGRQMWILITASTSPNANDIMEWFWAREPTDSGQAALGAMPQNNVNSLLSSYAGARTKLSTRVFDNQWHRVRFHIRESQPDSTYWNAAFKMWFDDSLWIDTERDSIALRTPDAGGFQRLKLGANKDHGGVYPHTEHAWWSHAILWTDTPSWYNPEPEPYLSINWDNFENEDSILAKKCSDPSAGCLFGNDSWYRDTFGIQVHLDTLIAPPNYEKSLRYDFIYTYGVCEPVPTTVGGICKSQTINTNIYTDTSVSSLGESQTTELWTEVWFRYSTNWSPCNAKDDPCAYKTIFYTLADENGRWSWRLGGRGEAWPSAKSRGWKIGMAGSGAGTYDDSTWWDSRSPYSQMDNEHNGASAPVYWRAKDTVTSLTDTVWHRVRMYAYNGSNPSLDPGLASLDGRAAMWFDNDLLFDSKFHVDSNTVEGSGKNVFPWSTADIGSPQDNSYIRYLSVGRNKDKAGDDDTLSNGTWEVPRIESIWWGPIKIWREDPGWLMWPDMDPVSKDSSVYNWVTTPLY